VQNNLKPFIRECAQGRHQLVGTLRRHLDTENSRELTAQVSHTALQPIAPVLSHALRNLLHQARAIRTNHRHHKIIEHASTLVGHRAPGNPEPDARRLIMQPRGDKSGRAGDP